MIIRKINSGTNFCGYDARPLQAVVMRNCDHFDLSSAVRQMNKIGAKHDFNVIFENDEKIARPWIQDILHFMADKMIILKDEGSVHDTLCKNLDRQKIAAPSSGFAQGGNIYVTGKPGNETILAGKHEKTETVKRLFPKGKIIKIPQADFHLDLFARPLKDNIVLVADDNMTLDMLQKGLVKLENLAKENNGGEFDSICENLDTLIGNMKYARNFSFYKDTEKVISALEKNGFKVVRTPGRIYKRKPNFLTIECKLINKLNFINAVATVDKNNEIVYISNKSNLPRELGLTPELAKTIGLDFEQEFKKAVSNYIKPENIYFIEGAKYKDDGIYKNIPHILEELQGGIHCLCAEIPKEQ